MDLIIAMANLKLVNVIYPRVGYCWATCATPVPYLKLKSLQLHWRSGITRYYLQVPDVMMTSWNGNIFRETGPLCGEFTGHTQRPVTRRFDAFFDVRLNKRLNKQSRRWWFVTPSRSLWCHCNESQILNSGQGTRMVVGRRAALTEAVDSNTGGNGHISYQTNAGIELLNMIYILFFNLELIATFMLCQQYGYTNTTRDSHVDQIAGSLAMACYVAKTCTSNVSN